MKDECLALAMSGGGSKGAYEAGAMWGMFYAAEDKSRFYYDVVTGVSAGAINSAASAVWAPDQQEQLVQDLSERW